jgi:hypothetical protein
MRSTRTRTRTRPACRARSGGAVAAAPPLDNQASDEEPYVGAPGGRQAGAPLDLGIMAEEAANAPPMRREVRQIPGALPPPPRAIRAARASRW